MPTKFYSPRRIGYALKNLGGLAHLEARYAEATDFLTRSLPMFEKVGDVRGEAESRLRLADAMRFTGQNADAKVQLAEALQLSEKVGDLVLQGDIYVMLAAVAESGDNPTEQEDYLKRSLAVRQQVGNPHKIVDSMSGLALHYAGTGDATRALQLLDETDALIAAEDLQNPQLNGRMANFRVMALLVAGDHQAAYDQLAPYLTNDGEWTLLTEDAPPPWALMIVHRNFGMVCLMLGKHDLAKHHFTQAVHVGVEIGATSWIIAGLIGLIRLQFLRGSRQTAVTYLTAVLRDHSLMGIELALANTMGIEDMQSALEDDAYHQAKAAAAQHDIESVIDALLPR